MPGPIIAPEIRRALEGMWRRVFDDISHQANRQIQNALRPITRSHGVLNPGAMPLSDVVPTAIGWGTASAKGVLQEIPHVDHRHGLPSAAGGGLGGNFPNPTVIKLRGVTVSSTPPVPGQSLVANTPTDASWQTGSGAGHIIQDEGVSLAARAILNFIGSGVVVTDDAAGGRTIVTITGGGGGGGESYGYYEPVTDGDPPEVVFDDDGDIVMELVEGSIAVPAGMRWEPITNGDPDHPELLFDADGDVLMTLVPV